MDERKLPRLENDDLDSAAGGISGLGQAVPQQPPREDNRTWTERLGDRLKPNPDIDPGMIKPPPNPNMDKQIERPIPRGGGRREIPI